MRVANLDGQLLDFWVAKAEGRELLPAPPEDDEAFHPSSTRTWHPDVYRPSSNWSHGLAVVISDWYEVETLLLDWFGEHWPYVKTVTEQPLKWMLRAFVATRFGEEVEDAAAIGVSFPNVDRRGVPQAARDAAAQHMAFCAKW